MSGTAEIDIEAGYQRMCGYNALQYVRFRHFDNDLVRSARQQDFLREARQKLPPQKLIDDRNELLDIFTEYTTSDIGDAVQLLELLKTFLARAVGAGAARSTSRPQLGTTLRDRHRRRDQEGGRPVPRRRGHPRRAPGGRVARGRRAEDQAAAATAAARTTSRSRTGERPLRGPADGRLDRAGPAVRPPDLDQEAQERRADGRLPDLLPDPAGPGLDASPRTPARSRSTAPTRTSTTATRWSSTFPATPSATASSTSTTASRAPTGSTRRSSRTRPRRGRSTARDYLLFYDGDRLRLVGWKTEQGRLLGQQHAAAVARRGPDALDRDLDARVRSK